MANRITKALIKTGLSSHISEKISDLMRDLSDIEKAKANETKSSAGDKYETSRAMLQQEKDKKMAQLDLWHTYQPIVKLLDSKSHNQVQLGSVVITDVNMLYVSVPAGKLLIEGNQVFAISTNAPLYKVLARRGKNEQVSFNGKVITIIDIL